MITLVTHRMITERTLRIMTYEVDDDVTIEHYDGLDYYYSEGIL